MTIDKATIGISAQGMIRNFGEEAYAKALENAEGFNNSSMAQDSEGVRVWLAIAAAIERAYRRAPSAPDRKASGVHHASL